MSRWSLLIFRSHVQRSRSKHSFEPSVLSTLYIWIPCLLALDRFCFYREDKPEFCTISVSETIVVKIIFFTDMLHRRFRSCRHVMSCSLQMVRLTSGGQYKDVHLPDYNTSVEVGSHRLTRPQKPPPTPKWEGLKDLEERTKVKRHVHLVIEEKVTYGSGCTEFVWRGGMSDRGKWIG